MFDVASRVPPEHGFNGIGLNDLVKGAGLTQGGFYKQFETWWLMFVRVMSRGI